MRRKANPSLLASCHSFSCIGRLSIGKPSSRHRGWRRYTCTTAAASAAPNGCFKTARLPKPASTATRHKLRRVGESRH
jgi:hypothetical protein